MFALMRPLKSLTNVNSQFQRGMAACQTLFAILDSNKKKITEVKYLKRLKEILNLNMLPLPMQPKNILR